MYGLRVRYKSRDASVSGEQRVARLPARFGRNPMNDCHIPHPFVSDFHAVVELIDGKPSVRDLNSRNGVFGTRTGRLVSGAAMPLADLGNVFILGGAVEVTVEVVADGRLEGARGSSVSGNVIGNRAVLSGSGDAQPPSLPPLSLAGAPFPVRGGSPARHASPFPMGGSAHPPAMPVFGADSLPPLAPVGPGARGQPAVAPRQGSARPPSQLPPGYAPSPGLTPNTQQLSMSAELMALMGLHELAASLVPGTRIETTGDIARLVTKLHDLVEVLCRCFIPMRDALARAGGSLPRGGAAAAFVATVPDSGRLASGLLDWNSNDFDGPEAVGRVFTELLMQHTLLVDGMKGQVENLMRELSPDAIERAVKDGGMFGRNRALWREYRARYAELVSEDVSSGAPRDPANPAR